MKPYGMTRDNYYDTDVNGIISNGRATRVGYFEAPPRSLRGGKKAAIRRTAKRVARTEGKNLCRGDE